VIDPQNALKPFLQEKGIPFGEFSANTDPSVPVFVSRLKAANESQKNRFEELESFISEGGKAVYMNEGGVNAPFGNAGKAPSVLPFEARVKQARGNWNCIPHIVRDHPLFEGLPVNQMMGPVYGNVWAKTTFFDAGDEPIVGSIGYDWFPDYDLKKRHYYGQGDTWWGSDVANVSVGKGKCVVSTMRIIQNLGKDPVADKILYNMIDFMIR
jgi:hypothetical protein